MNVTIEIDNKIVKLILKDKSQVVDEFVFPEEYNISEKLLPSIDELLKKHKLEAKDISKVDVKTDLGESFTSRRIAEAVANTWNLTAKRNVV